MAIAENGVSLGCGEAVKNVLDSLICEGDRWRGWTECLQMRGDHEVVLSVETYVCLLTPVNK